MPDASSRPTPLVVEPGDLSFWWTFLNTVGGAMSLISLVQRYFEVGMAPILARLLEAYRSLLYPLFNWIEFVLPFSIPGWYKDLFLLSYVLALALLKSLNDIAMRHRRNLDLPTPRAAHLFIAANTIIIALPIGATFLGYVVPFYVLHIYIRTWGKIDLGNNRTIARAYFLSVFSILLTATVFFLVNTQL